VGRGSTGIAGWGWLHDCGSFGDGSAVREIAAPCGLAMTVVVGGMVPLSGVCGQAGWAAGACPPALRWGVAGIMVGGGGCEGVRNGRCPFPTVAVW